MVTIKRICALAAAVLALAAWTVPAFADTETISSPQSRRVYDYADLLSDSEEALLEDDISAFISETGMDFIFLSDDSAHSTSSKVYAADFYDAGGFGMGDELSGALYFIDMYERVPTFVTHGTMIQYITDSRLNEILDQPYDDLANGDYYGAAELALELTRKYVAKGIPEGQYNYDQETGAILTTPYNYLTRSELIASCAVGLAIGLIVWFGVSRGYRLKGNSGGYDVSRNASCHVTGGSDRYIRTAVSAVTKSPPPSRGGGGGGGFSGGGSGTFHSSGGGSFGGGSGRHF